MQSFTSRNATISFSPADYGRLLAVTLAGVLIASVLRIPLADYLHIRVQVITYFPIIVLAAWIGGMRGGLISILFSLLACVYLFPSLNEGIPTQNGSRGITFIVFIVIGLTISAMGEIQLRRSRQLEESRRELTAIVENASDGIVVSDLTGNFQILNAAGLRILGFNTLDDARRNLDDFGTLFVCSDRDGAVLPRSEWPLVRMMRGEEVKDYEMHLERSDTGKKLWLLVDGRLVRDSSGKPILVVAAYKDITARKQSETEAVAAQLRAADELARQLKHAREHAERESLRNRINEAIRSSADPDTIPQLAVGLLGEALGADRCYLATYDLNEGSIEVLHDWHRSGLPSIQGSHAFANTVPMFQELYRGMQTSVIPDALSSELSEETLKNMRAVQVRARVSVAIEYRNAVMATLTVAMSEEPREWTEDEVALIEAVATMIKSAVELARVQLREHRIATQLQQALLPPIPKDIPDLQVAVVTRPALAEAQVGGDFYDVFQLDQHRVAVVIGDVSGKGLAAAAQLATVRNSLRMMMYHYDELRDAAVALNRIFTAHNLMVGFVTIFMSVYDSRTGKLRYLSTGHEPALVMRANQGCVDVLNLGGPPVGVVDTADYTEHETDLGDNDCLILYTDGLSEAGVDRKHLFGTDGLANFAKEHCGSRDADELAERIINHVSDVARGDFKDDICLLIARRAVRK